MGCICADNHDLVRDFGGPRPTITVLCGSTRFVDEFNRQAKALTEAGHIVLSIEVVTTQAREDDPQHADPELKARLDELHLRKIDLADEVLVLNVGGYIGDSTSSELSYADRFGKPVRFLEPLLGGAILMAEEPAAAHLPGTQHPHQVAGRTDLRTSHFATCERADAFRRPR